MAREQLDQLLNRLLPTAQHLLKKFGEFYPVGARLLEGGQLIPTAVYDGDEHPAPDDVIRRLREAFQALSGEEPLEACGIAYDGRIAEASGPAGDAIILDIESREEVARVAMPYVRRRLRGWRFGDLVRLPYERCILPEAQ